MPEERRRRDDSTIDLIRDMIVEGNQERRRLHAENTKRLDALAGIHPLVERHEDWIEGEGKPAVKKIAEIDTRISNAQIQVTSGYKGLKLGLLLGGSGAAGAGIVKIMGLIASAISH